MLNDSTDVFEETRIRPIIDCRVSSKSKILKYEIPSSKLYVKCFILFIMA